MGEVLTDALAVLAAEQPQMRLEQAESGVRTAALPVTREGRSWPLLLAADDSEGRLVVQGLCPVEVAPESTVLAEQFVLHQNRDLIAATFDLSADGTVRCRCSVDLGGLPEELITPELGIALLRDLVLRCTALCAQSWPELARLLRTAPVVPSVG